MFPSSRVSSGAPFPSAETLAGLPGQPGRAALHLRGSASWQPEPQTAGDKLRCVTVLLRGSVPVPKSVPKARCDHPSCGQGLPPGRSSNLPLSGHPSPPRDTG